MAKIIVTVTKTQLNSNTKITFLSKQGSKSVFLFSIHINILYVRMIAAAHLVKLWEQQAVDHIQIQSGPTAILITM